MLLIKIYTPDFPTCSNSVRNVRDTTRLHTQVVAVDIEFPVLLAHVG